MFSFRPMKRWQAFAMLLLTVQVPAFAQGIDFNTRSFQGGPINEATVGELTVKWVYQTVPDTGTTSSAQGSISSTPALDGRYLYFNDMSGFLTKLDRFTGKLVWKKNYVSDLSAPGFVIKSSRNTPYVKGDLLIVGSNMGLTDRLCRMTGRRIPASSPWDGPVPAPGSRLAARRWLLSRSGSSSSIPPPITKSAST